MNRLKNFMSSAIDLSSAFLKAKPEKQTFSVSLSDPSAVLDSRMAYLGTLISHNGQWYDPPVSPIELAQLRNATAHHGRAIRFKVSQLVKNFVPSDLLNQQEFAKIAYDYLLTGDLYLQRHFNRLGGTVRLSHQPVTCTRRAGQSTVDEIGSPLDFYIHLTPFGNYIPFQSDEIIHHHNYDPLQSIYGTPDYLCGRNDVLLGEIAGLVRYRWYKNGTHLGYVLATSELDGEQAEMIKKIIEKGKGIGNGKSLYINVPRGVSARKPVEVIPIGGIGSNDNFSDSRDQSEQGIITAHGVPPILMGMIPENVGGLGDPIKALQIYHETVGEPLQTELLQINERVSKMAIQFRDPDWKLPPQLA